MSRLDGLLASPQLEAWVSAPPGEIERRTRGDSYWGSPEDKAIVARVTACSPEDQALLREERDRREQARQDQEWLSRKAEEAGVPSRLIQASFAGKKTRVLERVRKFMEEEEEFFSGRGLVLCGPTGVGKSYAAAAALREASRGCSIRFWYFPVLCGTLMDPERRRETLRAVKTTDFVVLDDFGVEYRKDNGFLEALIDEIIWHRESEILATIITTNFTVQVLKARLSARIVDRLCGPWGSIFHCPGRSLRIATSPNGHAGPENAHQ